MGKVFTFVLAIAVCLWTTAMLAHGGGAARQARSADVEMTSDGAFRDGVFVGRLAAERGQAMRPLIARWSNERDRALFVSGYRQGYGDFLAGAAGASAAE